METLLMKSPMKPSRQGRLKHRLILCTNKGSRTTWWDSVRTKWKTKHTARV